MPRQGSISPAPRPQLDQRASSSHSLPRGSPNTGQLSKVHNRSSTKLHRPHAVGHGRHPHARVPSYGKGLHKLSKLGPREPEDGTGHARNHTRSGSHTPSGSPTPQDLKRNGSQVSLPRVGSKASVKKNASNISMTKLGNQAKSEKAQTKNNLRKKGTDDAPLKGTAKFSVGEDGQEEDWEEASSSQSPYTTRHSSNGRKTPQLEDPPSPDEPTPRSPTNLPHSPPQSPPTNPSAFVDYTKQDNHQKASKYSQPLDGDEVSQRLLNRSRHNADPKLSNMSATVSPNGSSGSPVFRHNHDSNFSKEPSMPADGISRFLSGTVSRSESPFPDSISQIQSHLEHVNRSDQSSTRESRSPNGSPKAAETGTRRVKSAIDLSHPRLEHGESSSSVSPTKEARPVAKKPVKSTKPSRVSPYESARGADPSAGKSLTQLKLDLQRMSTMHDTPSNSHPLMFQHNSVVGIQNLNMGSGEMAARFSRQYQQARTEYQNARRFYPDLLVGQGLSKKVAGAKKRGEGMRAKGTGAKTPSSAVTPGSSSEGAGARGRVKFDIGRSPGDAEEAYTEESMQEIGGVEGLLTRMWHQRIDAGVGSD